MSAKGIEEVLSRAMSDASFVDALFANAEEALASFDLTAQEMESFKGMSRADFETYAKASPEDRKSMWGAGGGTGI